MPNTDIIRFEDGLGSCLCTPTWREVGIAAQPAGKVTKFCCILNPELAIQHILTCVKELSSYSSQHVRSALAFVMMGMATVFGKVVEKTIRPCLVDLAKDPDVDVRFFANQAGRRACDSN